MKKIIIFIVIILLIASGIYLNYGKKVKITFNADKYYGISAAGIGITISTTDKKEVKEIIEYLNSMSYSENFKWEETNKDPDTSFEFLDKNENSVEKLEFYGNYLDYKNKQYTVITKNFYDEMSKLGDKIINERDKK